VFRITVGFNQR